METARNVTPEVPAHVKPAVAAALEDAWIGPGMKRVRHVLSDIIPSKPAEVELRRLYEQTRRDAETKTELLREINHRVKNNLISILGLIRAEQLYTPNREDRPVVKGALEHLNQRVQGLIEVHQMLSETQWRPMRLSELARRIINAVANSLGPSKQIAVSVTPSPALVSPRLANSLALTLNELATNTLKYGAAGRMMTRVTVRIDPEGEFIRLEYRDDGPGFPADILNRERQGVGLVLLQQLTTGAFRGSMTLANDNGAVAVLRIKSEEVHRT
jgi:two-component sensor histidine kinase